MLLWKWKILSKKEPFRLYKKDKAFYDSFIDQIFNMFSFSAQQEPFKAVSEDDIWREINKHYY